MTETNPSRIRVYVSGPLSSSGDRLENIATAKNKALELIAAGFAPLCPHLTHFLDPQDTLGQQTWYEIDLPWVSVAEAVLRLPGKSRGADLECELACQLGIPIYDSIQALSDHPPPQGDERFHALLHRIRRLHNAKQQDYGRQGDPLANVRGALEWGIKPWIGAMLRATDKLKRLQQFARTGHLANEGVVDSFLDLSVYSLIALILYQEEQKP